MKFPTRCSLFMLAMWFIFIQINEIRNWNSLEIQKHDVLFLYTSSHSLNLPILCKSKETFYLWLEMFNLVQLNQNQETLIKSLFKGMELTSTCVVFGHGEAIAEMALVGESQNARLDCFKSCGQKLHTPANPPPVLSLFTAATEPAAALGGGRRLLLDEEQLALFHHHVRHL